MAQCPQCQGSITIEASHFGTLFTCPKCHSVFFVDWNGVPEAQNQSASGAVSEEPPAFDSRLPGEESLPFPEIPDSHQTFSLNPNFDNPPEAPVVEPTFESVDALTPPPLGARIADPREGGPSLEVPLSADSLDSLSNLGETSSEAPQMLYDLTIDGLDVKSTWEPVKDVLLEPRLKLDVQSLEQKIRSGSLTLKKQSPLVVFYVVQKIKSLNVKLHWTVNEG